MAGALTESRSRLSASSTREASACRAMFVRPFLQTLSGQNT